MSVRDPIITLCVCGKSYVFSAVVYNQTYHLLKCDQMIKSLDD